MIEAFFKTKFLKGRHTRRVKKLDAWNVLRKKTFY
jgi:ribose 5-phosphate isomerase RpiB